MFRKPKRNAAKANLRTKGNDDEDDLANSKYLTSNDDDGDADDNDTSAVINDARKRLKKKTTNGLVVNTSTKETVSLHSYQASKNDNDNDGTKKQRDLVTSTADYHPTAKATKANETSSAVGFGEDGIFRNQQQNKFHAGPIRAATHVRVTARFDYQPDICKDYKETGFCGYGDTCIYLHDRGDTLSGWQLEKQWEQQQKLKKEQQEKEMNDFAATGSTSQPRTDTKRASELSISSSMDDGIPFACYLCRKPFVNPVGTKCLHYFCESCIMDYVRNNDNAANIINGTMKCPICSVNTGNVFNEPTKLIAKRRKILGADKLRSLGNDDKSLWIAYAEAMTGADHLTL